MDSQLIVALAERIKAGHTKEQIKVEVLAVGHDEEAFEAAYQAALEATTTDTIPKPVVKPQLPKYLTLLQQSLRLVSTQMPLFFKTLLSFVLIVLTTTLAVQVSVASLLQKVEAGTSYSLSAFVLMAGVVLLPVAALVGMVAVFTGLMRALLKREESVRYRDGVWWVLGNIVPISLVIVYVQILTQVGYAFFVIPGVMLTIYLFFSLFLVLSGKDKGIAALVSSTSLVYGRFWPIFGRFVFSIALIGVAMLVAILLALAISFLPELYEILLALPILLFIITASYWHLCYAIVLFESLQAQPVAEPLPCKSATLYSTYKIIVVVVLTLIVFVVALLVFGATAAFKHGYFTGEWSETSLKTDVMQKQLLNVSIKNAFASAEQNGNNFEYVCTSLALPSTISCEDTANSVAIEAPLTEGFYCVDSLFYNEVSRRSIITLDGTCGVVARE